MLTVGLLLAAFTAGAAEPTPPPTQYHEPFAESFPNRREQHLQIKAYADKLLKAQTERTLHAVEPDFSSAAAYERSLPPFRGKLGAFYGTPPPGVKAGRVTKFLQIGDDADCTIFQVWIEVVVGVEAYGIYMVSKKLKGKAPLLIAQRGGGAGGGFLSQARDHGAVSIQRPRRRPRVQSAGHSGFLREASVSKRAI